MNSGVTIFGDPHGDFSTFHDVVVHETPQVAVILGDLDLERPLEEEAADLLNAGSELYWITGNHDTDRDHWYDFLFGSKLADQNIGGRVVTVNGIRIAGLGGVFRGTIWNPRDGSGEPRFRTRDDFIYANQRNKWRGGLPRKHRSTIFPEDIDALSYREADVLVTHEAPSNHQFGFEVIDTLAEALGVKMIIHGHHHRDYEDVLPNGIKVIGVGKASYYRLPKLIVEAI